MPLEIPRSEHSSSYLVTENGLGVETDLTITFF